MDAPGNYDRLSRWYDLFSGPFESRWRDLGVSGLSVEAGQSVLEIGCGTGHALAKLAEAAGPAGAACGLDLSAGMCRVALANLQRARHSAARVVQGNAAALPFASGSFDAVLMSFTLELFTGDVAALVLAECHRVLQPDGKLGVVALDRREHANFVTRLYEWSGRRFPKWIDCHLIRVADDLSAHGFIPIDITEGSIAGLPVAVVIAQAGQPGALSSATRRSARPRSDE